MNRREFLAASTAAVSMLATGRAFGQARPAYYPADYDKLVEASKAEGPITLYSNMEPESIDPIVAALRQKYSWINVENLNVNGNEVIERYLAESGTGTKTADILLTVAPEAWIDLAKRDQVLEYVSPELSQFPDWKSPTPGIHTISVDPLVFIWNKLALPEELWPKSFEDLVEKAKANPDIFNGKLVSYGAHLTSFGYDAHHGFAKFHGEKVWDWYNVVGPMTKFERSTGPMIEKTIAGEYLVGYFAGSGGSRLAARDPAKGQVLAMSYISDGTPMQFRTVAVPKAATNVASAKLMLDHIMSREGQIALAKGGRTPIRLDVTKEDAGGLDTYSSMAADLGADKLALIDYDPALITDYDAFVARWKKANGVA